MSVFFIPPYETVPNARICRAIEHSRCSFHTAIAQMINAIKNNEQDRYDTALAIASKHIGFDDRNSSRKLSDFLAGRKFTIDTKNDSTLIDEINKIAEYSFETLTLPLPVTREDTIIGLQKVAQRMMAGSGLPIPTYDADNVYINMLLNSSNEERIPELDKFQVRYN